MLHRNCLCETVTWLVGLDIRLNSNSSKVVSHGPLAPGRRSSNLSLKRKYWMRLIIRFHQAIDIGNLMMKTILEISHGHQN